MTAGTSCWSSAPSRRPNELVRGRGTDPQLAVRRATRALADRGGQAAAARDGTSSGWLLLSRSPDRTRAWPGVAGRMAGTRARHGHPRAARRLARPRLSGRDSNDARPPYALAARRPRASLVLRAGRGGRDDHLPNRGALRLAPGHRRAARLGARRRRRVQAPRLQDGDRVREDDGDGDALRVEHPQQGRRARRRALLRCRPRRLPEPDDPGPPPRARPESRRGFGLPRARSRALTSDAEPAPRAGARQELA